MGLTADRPTWSPEASALVRAVNGNIPRFVRGMVERVVTREAERVAEESGAGAVRPEHVRTAYENTTPRPMLPLLRKALGEDAGEVSPEQVKFAVGEPMTPEEIRAFLDWEGTGRLGAIDAEGRPYVVPLSFVHDGGAVYYHWFSEDGRKTRALQRHRQVCFEADWATRDQLSYRSVIADGEVDEIVELAERARILDLLALKFPAYATGAGHSDEIQDVIARGREAMAEGVRIYRVRFHRVVGKKKGGAPPGLES